MANDDLRPMCFIGLGGILLFPLTNSPRPSEFVSYLVRGAGRKIPHHQADLYLYRARRARGLLVFSALSRNL
jgi:hypothetical protein